MPLLIPFNRPNIAEQYILHSGFLPVAEANGIIVIFPLTTKVPKNMDGCWDFYSYTDSNFGTLIMLSY